MITIYQLLNPVSGYSYIGQTKGVDARVKGHVASLQDGSHYNELFQLDFIRTGKPKLKLFEITRTETRSQALALEKQAIRACTRVYNDKGSTPKQRARAWYDIPPPSPGRTITLEKLLEAFDA